MELTLALAETASSTMLAMADIQKLFPTLELPLSDCANTVESILRGIQSSMGVPYTNGHSYKNGHSHELKSEIQIDKSSSWDPEPIPEYIEVSRCRALLLEIVRRAAHDWVLYRMSNRMLYKQIAEEAYTWLFEEKSGHINWEERAKNDRFITAFLTICELLDLDPETVRERVRKMTIKAIMGAGRPAEKRYPRETAEEVIYEEHALVDVDLSDIENDDKYESRYEAQYATSTPAYF